jgi:hypothetical protein
MKGAAEHSNDKHVPVWTKLCQEHKILNTPLSPYIDKELLYANHLFVDGTKITKDSKFTYKEKLSAASIEEVVKSFIKQVGSCVRCLGAVVSSAHAALCPVCRVCSLPSFKRAALRHVTACLSWA